MTGALPLLLLAACAPEPAGVTVDCDVPRAQCVRQSFAACVSETFEDFTDGDWDSREPLEVIHTDDDGVVTYCLQEVSGGCDPGADEVVVVDPRALGHELAHALDRREGGDGDYGHVRGDYDGGDLAVEVCS